jgi:hypothetical protein
MFQLQCSPTQHQLCSAIFIPLCFQGTAPYLHLPTSMLANLITAHTHTHDSPFSDKVFTPCYELIRHTDNDWNCNNAHNMHPVLTQ